jgi:hypothetical protein
LIDYGGGYYVCKLFFDGYGFWDAGCVFNADTIASRAYTNTSSVSEHRAATYGVTTKLFSKTIDFNDAGA